MCNSCFVSGSERGRGQRAGGGAGDGPRSHLEEDSRVHVHPTSWKVAFFFNLSNHCVHCCCGHWCEVDKLCDMRHFSYCISIVNALYGAEAQATRRIWRRRNFLYCENWAAAAERWPDRTSLCFNRRSNSQLLTHSHSYMCPIMLSRLHVHRGSTFTSIDKRLVGGCDFRGAVCVGGRHSGTNWLTRRGELQTPQSFESKTREDIWHFNGRDHDVPHTGQIYSITLCTAHTLTHTRGCYGVFLTDMSHFNKISGAICLFFLSFFYRGNISEVTGCLLFRVSVSWSRLYLVLGGVLGSVSWSDSVRRSLCSLRKKHQWTSDNWYQEADSVRKEFLIKCKEINQK